MRIERKDMQLNVLNSSHRPSWKITGNGSAQFRANTHKNAQWVSLFIGEYGPKSSRETYMTLDKAAGEALRDLLNEAFPKEK